MDLFANSCLIILLSTVFLFLTASEEIKNILPYVLCKLLNTTFSELLVIVEMFSLKTVTFPSFCDINVVNRSCNIPPFTLSLCLTSKLAGIEINKDNEKMLKQWLTCGSLELRWVNYVVMWPYSVVNVREGQVDWIRRI